MPPGQRTDDCEIRALPREDWCRYSQQGTADSLGDCRSSESNDPNEQCGRRCKRRGLPSNPYRDPSSEMTDSELLHAAMRASGYRSHRAFAATVLCTDAHDLRRWIAGERTIPRVIRMLCVAILARPAVAQELAAASTSLSGDGNGREPRPDQRSRMLIDQPKAGRELKQAAPSGSLDASRRIPRRDDAPLSADRRPSGRSA